MENCLVTKLKGVVDNSNLPKLGEGVFERISDGYIDSEYFRVYCSTDLTKVVTSDGSIYKQNQKDAGNSVVLDDVAYYLHMAVAGQKAKVQNIYDITTFIISDGYYYKGADIHFFENLKELQLRNSYSLEYKIDLEKALFTKLQTLVIYIELLNTSNGVLNLSRYNKLSDIQLYDYKGESIVYTPDSTVNSCTLTLIPTSDMPQVLFSEKFANTDLSKISQFLIKGCNFKDSNFNTFLRLTNVTKIDFSDIRTLSGNLAILGGLHNLETLAFPNTRNVDFVIEDFVANARDVTKGNRPTGSVTFDWAGASHTTFQGTQVPSKPSTILSWTATTITYDGVTIDA